MKNIMYVLFMFLIVLSLSTIRVSAAEVINYDSIYGKPKNEKMDLKQCCYGKEQINKDYMDDRQRKASANETQQDKINNGKWKVKKKHIYYYDSEGKKVIGLVTIKKHQYYFDSKGIQRTGWQKIKNDYYYFRINNKQKGYMITSKNVNGIKLDKSGRAKYKAGWKKDKLNLMVKCSDIIAKTTNCTMTRNEKLRAAYKYEIKNYRILGSPNFHNSAHWDVIYATRIMNDGHGACFEFGALFAYLANAAGGKKCLAVSSGGHGWAEVDGKVSDPNWDMTDSRNSYFQIDMSLSGKGGRPNYRRSRAYIKKI